MVYDYLSKFPIPVRVMPARLQDLLTPVDLAPNYSVEVACRFEFDPHGNQKEYLQLLMAVVPGSDDCPIRVLSETCNGLVESSTPISDNCGDLLDYLPSISGYDYIVAAWGDGSSYTYNLAEKVWMALGLTSRCVGNDQQRMVYDDLREPVFNVAEGEIFSSHHWVLQKNITWRMSNEYLRRYLWMRGARGVRVFFYEVLVADNPELRALMDGKTHTSHTPSTGAAWYRLDIREFKEGLLLQVWASVEAVMPVLCPQQTAEGLIWPGTTQPMTREIADNVLLHHDPVYLDDCFLQEYEQHAHFECTPTLLGNYWHCAPSYKGQWSFTECRRVGRNLIQIPMRELYKGTPDHAILRAHEFAVEPSVVANTDLEEEHIAAKSQRLLDVLLRLGCGLAALGKIAGQNKAATDWVRFDRAMLESDGLSAFPIFCRLAQVAPLDMTQQMFLARCKTLHEIVTCIPNGHLKSLLEHAGCKKDDIKDLGNLKLLQALLREPLKTSHISYFSRRVLFPGKQ